MPRCDSTRAVRTARRIALAASMATCVFPAAWAQTIPASVRACTLETDSLKRLVCFDKEIARYTGQPPATQGAAPPRDTVPPSVARSAPPPPPNDAANPAPLVAAAPAPAAPAAPSKPKHIAAHIVSIENFPDALIVHLDNGQVWEQIQEASADVNLHTGDAITIDRELGSYWLSGSAAPMKVRQRQ
jgi:hypothetical protein